MFGLFTYHNFFRYRNGYFACNVSACNDSLLAYVSFAQCCETVARENALTPLVIIRLQIVLMDLAIGL